MWVCCQMWVSPIILVAFTVHHIPTLTYVIELRGLSWETVILRVHLLTELKPSLTAKENGCELFFSIMQSTKVLKIQSSFIICIIVFENHSCLKWMQYKLCFCTFSGSLKWKLNQKVAMYLQIFVWNYTALHVTSVLCMCIMQNIHSNRQMGTSWTWCSTRFSFRSSSVSYLHKWPFLNHKQHS